MLLPRPSDEEDQDPRAELVRRLLEYEQIREISMRLQTAELERGRRFSKGFVPPRPRPRQRDVPLKTTWEDVFQAALGVELPETYDRGHRVTLRPVAMEDKVQLILSTLREGTRVEFSRLLQGIGDVEARMHGVMTLLASLELTRRRWVFMRQVAPFSELWLYRREEEEGEEGARATEESGETEPGADAPHEETP
jgi:segregation and condensation protein A